MCVCIQRVKIIFFLLLQCSGLHSATKGVFALVSELLTGCVSSDCWMDGDES